MNKWGKLLLVDGSALIHRAYHAMPELTDSKGEQIGAVYGVARMLMRAIQDLEADHVVVALDRPEPTFRKELFIGYQAHRPPLDEKLVEQFGKTREFLRNMEILVLDKAGFEADDIIGTLAVKAVESKFFDKIVIVTGDKDLMQLVSSSVSLYMPVRGMSETELVDEVRVVSRLGVRADQIVDYKALVGDGSDNYPGIHGIGPKGAVDLLAKYDKYELIWEHLEELPARMVEKLKNGKDGGDLSYVLATIKKDVEIGVDWDKARVKANLSEYVEVIRNFGFKSLASQLIEVKEQPKPDKQMGLF